MNLFIELTFSSNGKPAYLSIDKIVYIVEKGDGVGTSIAIIGEEDYLNFKENIKDVMGRIRSISGRTNANN